MQRSVVPSSLLEFWTSVTSAEIRDYQRGLIRDFVEDHSWYGKAVLDFGCGNAPYRGIIEAAGGTWMGYHRRFYPGAIAVDQGPDNPLAGHWDSILCTQVLQYVLDPNHLIARFRESLIHSGGELVLTYATNWPEVEPQDLWRFSRTGIEFLLSEEWDVVQHERLGALPFGDREQLPLGGGLVASPKLI